MKVLAMDTSNQALSVALLDGDKMVGQVTLAMKKNHSITLMPTIDFLCQSCDVKPADLNRIVVAYGPGSYTGVRIAVTTAKVLAQTLGIELVAVSSLRALVPADLLKPVVSLVDARRNHVYAGFYQGDTVLHEEGYYAIESVLELVKDWSEVTFVGEVAAFEELIHQTLPHARIRATLPDAGVLAQVSDAQPILPHALVPNYLKRVEAEEQWLEKQGVEDHGESYIRRV
ncbi:tRNA (adenosine(37)-N6)-threonylcarbamoyltransferase complex dimerization subunit type 1 TsaB [Streptococcus sp. 10F2]